MIRRHNGQTWVDVPVETYKDEPGVWVGVNRVTLGSNANTLFETRCFEIAPGGCTSLEKHAHEHCVVVLKGRGEVFLDGTWTEIGPLDFVHVPGWTIHQFRCVGSEPFAILCTVNRDRDRPQIVRSDEAGAGGAD